MEKKIYNVIVKFKNGEILEFVISSEEDLRQALADSWANDDVFRIGDYFVVVDEILWIRIESVMNIEEHNK